MANTSNCRRLRGSWRDDRGRDLCRRSTSRACRENCNDDHTDCLCRGPRSGRRGACGKFQPTRWQRDRNHYGHRTTRAEAFGNTARASAQGSQYCDLVNPNTPDAVPEIRDVQAVAQINGFQITTLNATSAAELDEGFKILAENRPEALPVGSDPFFMSYSEQLAKFASQAKIPAIYPFRESTDAGGLISYGTNIPNAYRQGGILTARVLKGETIADLPVQQPTKFELVINLKAAKALGLTVPPSLLSRADDVIE
jgi:ABC transporter substrate binding protein